MKVSLLRFGFQIGFSSFFIGSCFNLATHFDILRESYNGDKKKFVEKHQELLDLTDELCEIIKPTLFVDYLLASVVLCSLAFQIVTSVEIAENFSPFALGITVTVQLYINSYAGQEVTDKSSIVASNLFELDKDLVIIVARTKKPKRIGGVFFASDMATFVNIINMTRSLITLLKSIVK